MPLRRGVQLPTPNDRLMRACVSGNRRNAKLALDDKANIDHEDEATGQTALIKAARHNRKDVVMLLLNRKALSAPDPTTP